MSARENIKHSFDRLLRKNSGPARSKAIVVRAVGATDWMYYTSVKDAAESLRLNRGLISKCCRGLLPAVRNLEFQYAEPLEPENLPGEIWADVRNPRTGERLPVLARDNFIYPRVSSLGRVQTTFGIISRGTLRTDGYSYTNIGYRSFAIHRLVAAAFYGLPEDEDLHVHHKDGNKSNNHVDNLEYVTPRENVMHSFKVGRRTCGDALSKPVEGRELGSSAWICYSSQIQAARTLGLRSVDISKCCRQLMRQTGGFEFRFIIDFAKMLDDGSGEEWREAILPPRLVRVFDFKQSDL